MKTINPEWLLSASEIPIELETEEFPLSCERENEESSCFSTSALVNVSI